MSKNTLLHAPWVFAAVFIFFVSCLEEERPPGESLLELSLYTGISGVARLGDTYQQVTEQRRYTFSKMDISNSPDLLKLNFSDALYFRELGTRVYFRRGGIAMITAQEPFKGLVKSKNIRLFSFSVPPISDWEDLLLKELGQPDTRASGGRFGSEALFYSWGDISFNRMGPNEIALYRDAEITKYRVSHFGREVQLFPAQGK